MESLVSLMKSIESAVWGVPLLALLFSVGVFLTFLLRGVQFRYFFRAFRFLAPEKTGAAEAAGDISPFQSLMTAMASAVGTGSIVGVSTALMTGGLGAIFWMWVMSFIGMSL